MDSIPNQSGFFVINDDPDEKKYLVLLTLYPDPENINAEGLRDWSIKTGRQLTYDFLKELVRNELIDPISSFIIAGQDNNNSFKPESNPISVFRFLKVMFESNKVLDDGEFNVDDYLSEDTDKNKSIFDI